MARIALFLICSLIGASSMAVAEKAKLVRADHINERSRTLMIKNNMLLAGRTGTQNTEGSFVDFIDLKSYEVVNSVEVLHSIRGLQDINECDLLVYSSTGYSIVDTCSMKTKTYQFGVNFVPHRGSIDGGGQVIFSEPNGGMLRFNRNSVTEKVGDHISMTTSMQLWSDQIWITTYYNLWIMDPITGKRSALMEENEVYGLRYTKEITLSNGEKYIASTTADEKLVLIVDPESNTITDKMQLKGEPEGMTTYGNCLVVATANDKMVLFIEVEDGKGTVVDAWDANPAGDRLKHPTEIAVDPESMQVFLRSSYPCPLCTQTQSSIYSIYKENRRTDRCLL